MKDSHLERLKYPIGHFQAPQSITETHISEWIDVLASLPDTLTALVKHLDDEQLDTPYRPGGWTLRQTIHHMADSHHNSYMRFKWALTEDGPLIKAYDEKAWAELFDSQTAPIELSLLHLRAVHAKLVFLLRGLHRDQLKRIFIHPEDRSKTPLDENIGRYAWHSRHHLAHIGGLMKRKGWAKVQ
ncbi:YfiT family bacillithiol transferase [Pseudozobellia thermophila]|uniref:DinB superfamily protein n=1 Tax=Pseudozobellia thermophila TaxID=192903 RepID=A0A1M6HSQ7_9FLAO|nr:putative metal-dependent hydrolase [Pseudozobellia thermophila]SHJ25231.1 DinB superfamily protein [Pseudozobellia thermophila]